MRADRRPETDQAKVNATSRDGGQQGHPASDHIIHVDNPTAPIGVPKQQCAVPKFELHAWVDESITTRTADHQGTYVLAAVVADPTACDDIRNRFRSLAIRPGGRLHWRDEDRKGRDRVAHAVADADVAAVVVAGSPIDNARQERARRCCLERLLYELGAAGVSQTWLEARMPAQNKLDLHLVDSARDKSLIPTEMRIDFALPRNEPMLWLPDAVAGAVTAAELGRPIWLEIMATVVQRIDIPVR